MAFWETKEMRVCVWRRGDDVDLESLEQETRWESLEADNYLRLKDMFTLRTYLIKCVVISFVIFNGIFSSLLSRQRQPRDDGCIKRRDARSIVVRR
mmetsp:Transcript_19660/g.28597  ORF Transcript_19660/g.28597 Transcript_19660/m.28597 type:complete len:96 (-) Transcript_19660:19-306(-)